MANRRLIQAIYDSQQKRQGTSISSFPGDDNANNILIFF